MQRLGISYHFEQEIDETLEQIQNVFINNALNIGEGDLHSTGLLFRLLRQKGYLISSDIFNKFKNKKGKFNETIAEDIRGLWSLYEAAQLSVHGEDLLDEAHDFAFTNLKSMIANNKLSTYLAKQIDQSLMLPFHKGVPRIETRRYMSFYEEDPSYDKAILTFAKLDFNVLQKMHQKELGNITRWWKKSDFARKVPYGRDRVVEAYLWPFSMSSEPKYSTHRRIVGKLISCICLLDDTYDAYGTLDELELFTQAIKRWNISPIKTLPTCFQVVFNAISEVVDEIQSAVADPKKSTLVLQHVKQAFVNLAEAYLVEAKWCNEDYVPTYDEYKVNGTMSSSLQLHIVAFVGLGEFATKQVFDWIFSNPTIIKAVSLIGRLKDDLASHKFERERDHHVASGVECCMKQYGISEEETYKVIQKEIKDFWKDINEECLKPKNDIPKAVIECIVNLGRISEFTYANFQDRFTNGEFMKECVSELLLDPITIY
ncbi:hypothetical protein PIB30_067180 [Stylosanthes scabra]|uniref:Uncharacterized protein n=1 Tax=Stylosanthes scabra TaxID=79078 RepID=A0ABU6WP70_9FABA|nr:hypothetical protein [Stylosanthes scabra]